MLRWVAAVGIRLAQRTEWRGRRR